MKRQAFTLVELVVVILILGILAGVAAPRFLDTAETANEASLRQSLSVVRDAIELYAAQNGGFVPMQAGSSSETSDLPTELADYLRGGLPVCPVGARNNEVRTVGTAVTPSGADTPLDGWLYNRTNGDFVCNFNGATSDPLVTYDQL